MQKKFDLLTLVGIAAIALALVLRGGGIKLELPDWVHIPSVVPSVVVDASVPEPDAASKVVVEKNNITALVKAGKNPKRDGILLGQFYYRLGTLTVADSDVVKTNGDIKAANEACGQALFALSIKPGVDYPDFSKAVDKSLIETIGDDNAALTPEMRAKAVNLFQAIGWACQEGAK